MRATPARAELLGTAALVMAIVGPGIMADRLCGGNTGLALLANAIATGGALQGATVARAAESLGISFAAARAGDWPADVTPLLDWPADDLLRLLLNVDVPAAAAETLRARLPPGPPELARVYGLEGVSPAAYDAEP